MTLFNILVFVVVAVLFRLFFRNRWRGWMLMSASILAIYWIQSPLPIRFIDFWLPTFTLLLVFLCWAMTMPGEQRLSRENLVASGLLAGLVLVVGVTRYFSLSGIISASRPPETWQVAIVLLGGGILGGCLLRFPRSKRSVLSISIVLLIGLFVVLKLPALTLVASEGLRSLVGQSVAMANATDLRWLGFSYVAFRLIHTLRDRQLGRLPAVNLQEYMVYVVFFPSFTAGPIDRLDRFVKDLRKPLELSAEEIIAGSKRLVIGLFKKFALADTLALIALNTTIAPEIRSAGWMWLVLYAYSLQIYLDFSGYTDIAIGLGRLLGIQLPENFNQPYLKPNLTQFWNNWHMTLTQWLRAYFFNPLTRALRSARRPLPAVSVLFITQVSSMLLIGLWHGITWNFALWGLWHGIGLFVHNRWSDWMRSRTGGVDARPWLKKVLAVGGTLLTFEYVTLGWVWFALPDISSAGQVFLKLFGV